MATENKNIFTADEKDFIHSEEAAKHFNISIEQQLNMLDSGKLTAYERLPGVSQWIYADMEPDKWEKITGKSIPDPWPEEGVEVPVECKAQYRQLHSNEVGKLTPPKVTKLYYLCSEIVSPEDLKQSAVGRTSTTQQVYIALAERAETVIQECIRHNILPATIKEKLKVLKEDAQFQKIIKALPRTANDKTLEKRLRKIRPLIWELGKKSNEKYRRKSIYK